MDGTNIAFCDGLADALLLWTLARFVFHKKRGTKDTNWLLWTVMFDVEQDTELSRLSRKSWSLFCRWVVPSGGGRDDPVEWSATATWSLRKGAGQEP